MSRTQEERTYAALNVLGKWRKLFAGWQLGTRPDTDPVAAAVRDHREATLLLRAEVSALTTLLMAKGIFTEHEHLQALEREAVQLNLDLERRFPGVRSSATGLVFDNRVTETMKGWLP